eukprot:589210-Pyramimonas_sp.AAC.1
MAGRAPTCKPTCSARITCGRPRETRRIFACRLLRFPRHGVFIVQPALVQWIRCEFALLSGRTRFGLASTRGGSAT